MDALSHTAARLAQCCCNANGTVYKILPFLRSEADNVSPFRVLSST